LGQTDYTIEQLETFIDDHVAAQPTKPAVD
jgi:hypothetical protein